MRLLSALLVAIGLADAAAARSDAPTAEPFTAHTWSGTLYGGHNFGDPGKGEMWSGHLGVGYQVWDRVGLHLDAFGAYVRSGIDDDGAAIGADLIGRWHVLTGEARRWTAYLDAGVGLQQASTNYSGSRHFNFRLHPGLGGTLAIAGSVRMLSGVRYLHISDAAVAGGGGGGFDGIYLYLGSMFPLRW